MKLQFLILLIIISTGIISQNDIGKKCWIREDYVKSVHVKNDTLSEQIYLSPILGFSNVFNKKLGIMRFNGDEILNTVEIIKSNNTSKIKIKNIRGYLNDKYSIAKDIHNSKEVVGYLSVSGDKLLFQLWKGKILIDEFYYVDHYKDYWFKNLRQSYKYLYSIKHSN